MRLPLAMFALSAALLFMSPPDVRGAGVLPEELDCMLEPYEVVELSSQVPSIIEEITVDRGDNVKRGEVIARLKSGVESATVEVAEARVKFGRRKAMRSEELFEKRLISEHEKDELETEIQLAELQLREAQERLNLRIIRSTISGVVVERFHSPGEYVGEDPIVKIARIDPLKIEVVLPSGFLGTIRLGMSAEVRPEAPVGGLYTAKVTIVDQFVDAASGTFSVRLQLANPGGRLPPGLKCRVRFLE